MAYQNIRNRGLSAFEETSRAIWNEMQGISQQNNQEYTDEFYGINENEKVNINLLVAFIKRVRSSNTESFNWEHYVSKLTKSIKEDNYYAHRGFLFGDLKVPINVDWVYRDTFGSGIKSNFNVKLNKRKNDFIEIQDWSISKVFNSNRQKYEFTLSLPFQGTSNKRTNKSEDGSTFDIDDKYIAVQFKTDNLKDLFYLFKELQIDTVEYLAKIVYKYIKEKKNNEALVALYTQLPEELIKIMSGLPQDKKLLLDHLLELKAYDENSKLEDSSLAILNLFRIIQDIEYIYQILKEYPEIVLQLYYNMDGESSFLGEKKSNKLFFAEMMTGICIYSLMNSDDPKTNIVKEFKLNDEYKIDSKISDNGNSGLIFLQQQKIVREQKEKYDIDDGIIIPVLIKEKDVSTKNIGEADYLKPFDFVSLEIMENGEVKVYTIPAIMLKAIVDQQVKAELFKSIRMGIAIAALIIGIVTLGAGSGPLATTLAIADVILSTADVAILANEEQLLQTPEGTKFLETYNDVMLGIGVIAAPFAILGLVQMGLNLLKNAEQVTSKIIRSCILKVILEKNIINFEKQATFLLVKEIDLSPGNQLVFQRLQDEGLIYLKGIRQGDKTEKLFAVYDDVVLAEINNTPKGITDFAGQYRGVKENNLSQVVSLQSSKPIPETDVIRELLYVTNKTEIGATTNKVVLKLTDSLNNQIGNLTRTMASKGRALKYSLEMSGKKSTFQCEVNLLNQSMGKQLDLPVKQGENILYADINIPKEITDKYSGIGSIVLDDALSFYLKNSKFNKPDGVLGVWLEIPDYYGGYGGKSLNLKKFWEAVEIKKITYEEAAFETFTGKWAKRNGYSEVIIGNIEKDIKQEAVIIKFK